MSLLEHMAYDINQASVLVVSHLEYIRTQQFECLKRLRAHIGLALFVKLPLTSLIPICDKRTHRVTLSACTPFVSLTISLLSELVRSRTLE